MAELISSSFKSALKIMDSLVLLNFASWNSSFIIGLGNLKIKGIFRITAGCSYLNTLCPGNSKKIWTFLFSWIWTIKF